MNTSFPEAKKAKVALDDPVLHKVATITATLESDKFVVPGADANRQMLIAMAPSLLATPADQRHAHQHTLAAMFKEVFVTEETRLSQLAHDAEAKVTESSAELSAQKAIASSADSALKDKEGQIKAKLKALADDVGVTRTAESTLKELSSDLIDLEETQSFVIEEQQQTTNIKTEHFLMLKEGSWEGDVVPKDHVKALTSFFRKKALNADSSLVAGLPMGLGRKPVERSEFDSLVVTELEQKLEARLQDLAQNIESNVAKISEKNTLKQSADGALIAAKAQQRLSTEALLELKAQQKQLSSELSEKQQTVVDHELTVKAMEVDFQEQKAALESHKEILRGVLTELLERTTPIPEVVVEEQAVEVATEEMTPPTAIEAM